MKAWLVRANLKQSMNIDSKVKGIVELNIITTKSLGISQLLWHNRTNTAPEITTIPTTSFPGVCIHQCKIVLEAWFNINRSVVDSGIILDLIPAGLIEI